MAQWSVEVVETVNMPRTYIVEADSREDAIAKASIGDTVSEWDNAKYGEVTDRHVYDDGIELIEDETPGEQ